MRKTSVRYQMDSAGVEPITVEVHSSRNCGSVNTVFDTLDEAWAAQFADIDAGIRIEAREVQRARSALASAEEALRAATVRREKALEAWRAWRDSVEAEAAPES